MENKCPYKPKCSVSKPSCKNYLRCTVYQRFISLEDTTVGLEGVTYEDWLGVGAMVVDPYSFEKVKLNNGEG